MLFDKNKHLRISEFQAVVLAGYGSSNRYLESLYPVAEDDNVPKALLPVGNKPIISYTLDWLEKAGVHDAIVLIQASGNAPQKLSAYLARGYTGNLHCTVVSVPEDSGTADALRSVSDKIDKDFIVVPCDLLTELNPRELLDLHRVRNPTVTALFYAPSTSEANADDLLPYVGIDPTRQALVYKAARADDEDFSIRMSLLHKFARVQVHTDLQDAHLYIFKKWVLDMVVDKENISSISEDLIPMLVKCQYQKKLVDRESVDTYAAKAPNLLATALSLSTTLSDVTDDDLSAFDPMQPHFKSPVTTHVYVYRGGFCGRGNTIASYSELNRHATKQGASVMRVPQSAEVAPKTQVGNDSIIGEYTKIDERSSVKKSCVGAHCVIGKNVKVANSVIMDHVVIGDNAKVDGCVICNNAKVLEKSSLKDCEVAGEYIVEKESQIKGEKLVAFREAIE
ncbi:nucleotide-diphospho-sugar transferase [Radiomyces spectabilis]|uniref:nucleotide-diphospho-sugar transferase n=1 Tax=Radiomyces spectabilis TaxID=64574 RepID=UPI0022205D5E|nr:nucleotide-diphospho-sugar transferase [Radiomyces spectabilis]KAI8367645.1 nucleotide-diphospho-sugar transferase [Radiomyces spectabilis]